MQAEVFVSYDAPRTIAIRPCAGWQDVDSTQVMHFSLHPKPDARGQPQCSVRLEPSSDFEQSLYHKLHPRPIYGCLGLMHHGQDTFIVLITSCVKVGDIRLGESVYRIVSVKFFSLTGNTPDEDFIPGQPTDFSYDSVDQEQNMIPHPCRELEKVLSSGTFYFSPQVDITRSIQSRPPNIPMLTPGTRYNTRGIDDNGHVANFVETETILSNSEWCFAYTQIRGSVPVFWEQQGLQLMAHKIQLSRGTDATKPAVRRHFEELINRYEDVHIVDLLGIKDSGELTLSQEYRRQVEALGPLLQHVHMTKFDYHSQVKGGNYDQVQTLLRHVQGDSEKYGYFYHDLASNTIVQTQKGVFRTNCLDCLDRTNVIQSNLSKGAIESLFFNLDGNERERMYSLLAQHSDLWAQNGDSLSKIYTGTGALKSEVTRSGKMSLAGFLGDATKSINRFYINNFQDKDRQDIIDQLLGKMGGQYPVMVHDPVHESISSEMTARKNEYLQKAQIDVFVGTYNLNGKVPGGESLEPWLRFKSDEVSEPDLYVIGFQEIVKLTPKQIMATDVSKREVWEREVEKAINRPGTMSRYVQLRSEQLVGAALMIYVKEENTPNIKNVECNIKKTGMGGMAGNKGAVAIRMDYFETTLCFVTSHLASGQDNIDDRNNDFHTIDSGICFSRGRTILGHDIIIWCGDFNYRLDKENDEVRALASQGNYFELFKFDQLKRSIDYGEAFMGYREGIIAFAPTYRYDIGTDRYDTSEKYRAPAWTDRILYRGQGVYQTSYTRAELRKSDHRPVMSMFVLELDVLDAHVKDELERTLYRNNSSMSLLSGNDSIRSRKDNSALGIKAVMAAAARTTSAGVMVTSQDALPKPSSDLHQWWNDPLDSTTKRIPSNHRNPFVNDHFRVVTSKETTADTSRPASSPPPSGPSPPGSKTPAQPPLPVRKPMVDLLGDIDGSFKGPTILGQTQGAGQKGGIASAVNKRPPAPPPSRRAMPAPLAVGISGTKNTTLTRRPAPPPPQHKKADDTDDDDDDDDSDSNGVLQKDTKDTQKSLPASTPKAFTPVPAKDTAMTTPRQQQSPKPTNSERPAPPPSRAPKADKADENQDPTETLVKPSALKSGAASLYAPQKPAPLPAPKQPSHSAVAVAREDEGDVTAIRPKMTSSLVSAFEKNSQPEPSRTPSQPPAKIQLPGAEVSNGVVEKKPAPLVPSKESKPAVKTSTGFKASATTTARSALVEMDPSVAAVTTAAASEDGDSAAPPPSVSKLAKSFGQNASNGHASVNSSSSVTDSSTVVTKVYRQSDTVTPSMASPLSSKPLTSAPTIIKPAPTAAKQPLSGLDALLENDRKRSEQQAPGSAQSSTNLQGHQVTTSSSALSATKSSTASSGLSKLRQQQQPLPGLANPSVAPKTTTTNVSSSTTTKASAASVVANSRKPVSSNPREANKEDEERRDKLPEDGSVKNAIAALAAASGTPGSEKATALTTSTAAGGDGATKKTSDSNSVKAEEEEEKVDAFAFWKSK
ncbi:inositol polyphosphate 5-phosphatase [Actinomortierella ambigua]|uniref:phosphoinositide 5-phosphatase n=1 Tax=Actinomortierella ambigua TaxID=1343610 RepID=A0A9P6PWX7_9FUNG|nr:inositol polyphosphate 5-phosphatase [Actinomortierella ambigua]